MSQSRIWYLAVVTLGLLVTGTGVAEEPKQDPGRPAEQDDSAPLDQAALDSKFTESMAGVVFAGSYSVTSGGEEKPAQMEKYTITRVSKAKGDYWLFVARIQYGKTDLTVPMTLQVKWAGDTPVITLTDLAIPALGTFTSRVMIYGDRYAGTWQHGKTGGHLWGRLEKLEKPEKAEETNGKPAK